MVRTKKKEREGYLRDLNNCAGGRFKKGIVNSNNLEVCGQS